jgi:hypothetical protein
MRLNKEHLLSKFMDELNFFGNITFEVLEDSQPAINAQRKNVSASKFRHIKIKYHYVRQLIRDGWCKLVKINTKDQMADLATKILATNTTDYFSNTILGNTLDYSMCAIDYLYVTVDQSLYVPDASLVSYNNWGVMSTPYYCVAVLNG